MANTRKTRAVDAPEKALRIRQRQRLIDACISALHLYGPSSTTVEKVVAIADMSPGIVNFYFDSKAAMLVAALEQLAVEFEREVLEPVGALRADPARALALLIDLYLDPDLASPRKVSVWYAFWGEANSRQEYHDICGKKDEGFAALVQDLVARLIARTGQTGLDADGVALGLIGALEILWQNIAFQDEADIDRAAYKRRCRAYLRSVFPGHFAATPAAMARSPAVTYSTYADPALFPAWNFAAQETDIAVDWQQVVEYWLDSLFAKGGEPLPDGIVAGGLVFRFPDTLIDARSDGVTILQVLDAGARRSRVRRIIHGQPRTDDILARTAAACESDQTGASATNDGPSRYFREWLANRLPKGAAGS
jgi:TetR/AcrR family transcriptional repressor of bet genes